jgi:hypothetical protein
MGASLPGARVSLAVIGSPASVAGIASGDSFANRVFIAGVVGTSMRL